MAIVKLIKGTYTEEEDVRRVLDYICNVIKCEHGIYGGRNIIAYNSYEEELIAEQFFAAQYRRRFLRRIYQVVISFEQVDEPNLDFAYQVGQAVAGLYADYQSIFAVHEDKWYLHIHIIFNNCSIFPDKENLTNIFDIFRIRQKVDSMIDARLGLPKPSYSISGEDSVKKKDIFELSAEACRDISCR